MNKDEIKANSILVKFKDKIYFDWDGQSIISLFDAALVLEIKRPNAYKYLKEGEFEEREIGGAKFVTVKSVEAFLDKRMKKKEIIAFKKASLLTNTGVTPWDVVSNMLDQLNPVDREKAVQKILSSGDFQDYNQKKKGKSV